MNKADGMTNEEAVEILKKLKTMENIPFLYFSQRLALDLAINALKENAEWKEYKAECDSYHTK